MQIRTISNKIHGEFPELNHLSSTDFFQIWKSYEDELAFYLLNPSLPYLQFLSIGTFFIKSNHFERKIRQLQSSIPFIEKNKLENVNYIKLIERSNKVWNLINSKQEFYKKFLIYLDGWDTNDIPFYVNMINKLENYKKTIKELILEYDKRLITRNLEEQGSNS